MTVRFGQLAVDLAADRGDLQYGAQTLCQPRLYRSVLRYEPQHLRKATIDQLYASFKIVIACRK
jgi:hypothetical protein